MPNEYQVIGEGSRDGTIHTISTDARDRAIELAKKLAVSGEYCRITIKVREREFELWDLEVLP